MAVQKETYKFPSIVINRAKSFTNRLKKSLPNKSFDWIHGLEEEGKLNKSKFWRRRPKWDSSGMVWLSDCGRFVLKVALVCGPKPKAAIPTKTIAWHQGSDYVMLLQPRATVSERAITEAYTFFSGGNHTLSDLHEGNVAIFKGRPCLIDW